MVDAGVDQRRSASMTSPRSGGAAGVAADHPGRGAPGTAGRGDRVYCGFARQLIIGGAGCAWPVLTSPGNFNDPVECAWTSRHSGRPGVQRLMGGRGRPRRTLSARGCASKLGSRAIWRVLLDRSIFPLKSAQVGWWASSPWNRHPHSATGRGANRRQGNMRSCSTSISLWGRRRYRAPFSAPTAGWWSALLRVLSSAYQAASPTVCLTWRQTPGQSPRLRAVRQQVQPGVEQWRTGAGTRNHRPLTCRVAIPADDDRRASVVFVGLQAEAGRRRAGDIANRRRCARVR